MALFSIGHSNVPATEIVRLLETHHIEVLADVRSKPFSRRNPQFSKPVLAAALGSIGIEYRWAGLHLGGLGDTATDSTEFVSAMDELIEVATDRHVALMCAEANPADCHRWSKLGAWLADHRTISLSHIVTDGLLTQDQVGGRRPVKQGELGF